ncbi:MAG: VWA-like domain-containing protein [Streptosporangiaceae bacterium]|jgi:predicted metal-dependent peptidase
MTAIPGEQSIPGMAAARLWAATRFPYLATGIFGTQVSTAPGSGNVCVDERWRLRADPAVAGNWTPAQLGSVLVHHVCHLLRDHAERARSVPVDDADSAAWIQATDAEINDDLVTAGLELPGEPVLPKDLGMPIGKLAEEYFGASRQSKSHRYGQWGDCGSGAHGRDDGTGDGEQEPEEAGLDPWRSDLLRRQVAQDVMREPGSVPAGLRRWAAEVLTPRVDWRRLLAAELRRAIADVAGAADYSYRRPSRRATAVPNIVLPALRRPVPEVAVVCDTSGSMTDGLLALALAEVEGLLRALGLSLRLLACDAAVSSVRRVTSVRDVILTGGGGTDMGSGIAAAERLRPRPGVTVVLTDGFTPWPPFAPKGMRVVCGILGAHGSTGPAWARSVRIEREP